MRSGRLTAAALVESCLARVAEREAGVRAFVRHDPDALRRAAAEPRQGRLSGLPIGVKDVLDTADLPTEYGSPIWAGHRPRADAAAVAWALAEGGLLAGKTVTTEFATRQPGPTTNPHDARRTPGGSSSGSAAGVAAGFFPLAFGTQTAGSVIRPAAYCGVVGYKPTYGTISRVGHKLMSDSLDTIGVMARSVADCALLAGAVSGRDLDARLDAPPRMGVCRSPAWPHAAPETQTLLADAAARLARAGAGLADRELPESCDRLVAAQPIVMNAESRWALGWELAHAPDRISETLRQRLDEGAAHGPAALDAARAAFVTARAGFAAAMEGLDVLITPAAPGEAPEGLGWTGDPAFNAVWTALHVPCVTVPAGQGPNGLPLGLQIVARLGADRQALACAAWTAAALGG